MKLVISDLDGTLLNDRKELPPELFSVMEQLKNRGVRFGIASGRQYHNIASRFTGHLDDLLIMAENGSLVKINGQLLIKHSIANDLVRQIAERAQKYAGFIVGLSGFDHSYILSHDEDDIAHFRQYYQEYKLIESVDEIFQEEECIKVAIFDKKHEAFANYKLFEDLKDELAIVVSSEEWIDFNAKGTSKGAALKEIKQQYHLSDKDVVVFGDFDNDISILQEAYYSYAMTNASQGAKEAANFICPGNNNNGVIKTLCDLFSLTV